MVGCRRLSRLGLPLLVFPAGCAPYVSEEGINTLAESIGTVTPAVNSEPRPASTISRFRDVLLYHFRSKHFIDVQADLPAQYMEWSSQPTPWRTYAGAPEVALPHGPQLLVPRQLPLTVETLGSFLRLSAGISAWKSYDGVHKWALRIAPSSGNLQTTEFHVAIPGLGGPLPSAPTVCHYHPEKHALEVRAPAPEGLLEVDSVGMAAGFLVILTSICVREAWKYGERALRSCHLNAGHAIGALLAAAELHGWRVAEAPASLVSQEAMLDLLKLPPVPLAGTSAEEETPELVMLVSTEMAADWAGSAPDKQRPLDPLAASPGWPLSLAPPLHRKRQEYQVWPEMDAAQRAAAIRLSDPPLPGMAREHTRPADRAAGVFLSHLWYTNGSTPGDVVLQRRSALKMAKGSPAMLQVAFLAMLLGLCRSPALPAGIPAVHVLLMVHNVDGVPPGLYLLVRNREDVGPLGSFTRREDLADFRSWASGGSELARELEALAAKGCYLLVVAAPADVREAAQLSACGQEIAGEGSLAAAFLGRFHSWHHPHAYLELLWEAGLLGHMLYLAAQASGLGATGIGCFFDDFTASLLSNPGSAEAGSSTVQTWDSTSTQYQVLYVAAVGHAERDPRLLSYDPYHHLDEAYAYEPLQGGVGRIWRKA